MLLSVYKTKRDYTEMVLIPQTKPETKRIAAAVRVGMKKSYCLDGKKKYIQISAMYCRYATISLRHLYKLSARLGPIDCKT